MNICKKALTALSLLFALCASAQSREALWLEYYPDFQVGRWKLTPEISYRSVNFNGTHTVYFRPTATYQVNKYLSLAGSLAYYATWTRGTLDKHEWVIFQNAAARTPSWAGFSLGLNARLEQMFVKTPSFAGTPSAANEHVFGLRLRLMPSLRYDLPFWEKGKPALTLFSEHYHFITSSQAGFFNEGLDLGASFGFSPSSRVNVTAEYRRQRSYRLQGDSFVNLFRIMVRQSFL